MSKTFDLFTTIPAARTAQSRPFTSSLALDFMSRDWSMYSHPIDPQWSVAIGDVYHETTFTSDNLWHACKGSEMLISLPNPTGSDPLGFMGDQTFGQFALAFTLGGIDLELGGIRMKFATVQLKLAPADWAGGETDNDVDFPPSASYTGAVTQTGIELTADLDDYNLGGQTLLNGAIAMQVWARIQGAVYALAAPTIAVSRARQPGNGLVRLVSKTLVDDTAGVDPVSGSPGGGDTGPVAPVFESFSVLPTPSATYHNRFVFLTPIGEPEMCVVCLRDADGGYEWKPVAGG